jgi:hypothetical protein
MALWIKIFAAVFTSILFTTSGCSSPDFRYLPAQNQTPDFARRADAIYLEPPINPTGMVRILSMGVDELKAKNDSKTLSALHLRMLISNNTDTVLWTVNTQELEVSFPNHGSARPIYVNTDATAAPNVEIKPRELKSVDLYFPLPEGADSAKDLPNFDFFWQARSGDTVVRETTPFDRVQIVGRPAPYGPYAPYSVWWGPVWTGPPVVHYRSG